MRDLASAYNLTHPRNIRYGLVLETLTATREFDPQEVTREFGQAFAEARRKLGLRQIDVAETLGIVQTRISQIEGGKENPTLEKCAELVWALGGRLRFVIELPDQESAESRNARLLNHVMTTLETLAETIEPVLVERAKKVQAKDNP